ncbi:MAG: endonuclease/exonuclease/phosphatase family protein [Treponema sp.]|nr:endonuclease/exonuclease/phosphatase family protein [Treponema sp.]
MIKLHIVFGAAFLSLVFSLGSCSVVPRNETAGNTGALSVMLWNVDNLFDGVDAGTEYDEYSVSAGWNEKKYAARILSISQAIESAFEKDASFVPADGSPPALIGLVEVENLEVLEDLASGSLAKYGYNWAFFGKLPEMALGAGVLSRFPLDGTRVHSITAGGETTPRPVMEFRIESEGESIAFFLCHWKSKIGNDEATEALRRSSARVINRRLAEIRREEPDLPVIIMGDLNENHDEFYRVSGALVSALLPDDPWAASLSASQNTRDFLVLSGKKPPQASYFEKSFPVFYTPWGNELSEGSYYYKKDWETIDHFLLSAELFNGKGWDFHNCRVLSRPPFIGAAGFPIAYTPRNGAGLSDHLPLMLYLKKAAADL